MVYHKIDAIEDLKRLPATLAQWSEAPNEVPCFKSVNGLAATPLYERYAFKHFERIKMAGVPF